MNDDLIGKLDESLSELLAGRGPKPGEQPPLSELVATAREFSLSPRPAFRARLRSELDLAAGGRSSGAAEGLDLIAVSGKPNSSISSGRLAGNAATFQQRIADVSNARVAPGRLVRIARGCTFSDRGFGIVGGAASHASTHGGFATDSEQ